jgi:hypothetical protein
MRNLLAFLAAAVLVFLTMGWYLGWYTFRTLPTSPGHHGYTIDIDTKKTEHDVQQGLQKGAAEIKDLLKKVQTEEPAKPAEKTAPTRGANFNQTPIQVEEEFIPATDDHDLINR